jgi:C-terminal processing protease CtpA/Prc
VVVLPAHGALRVRSTRAGLFEGDRILAVDGTPVALPSEAGGWDWAIPDLSGPRGSLLRLTVERPATGEILHLDLIRDTAE